ncbi:Bro-N domain-containing protein [Pseudomonas shirazica]|uniref:BRO-N domain-containing protein n=1 Tax=Pseudomonas shirazica TaxID=1940636 RepID=UPI0025A9D77A|nr:Bro-N domain-containing protein [Pseudomonas shirazica]MDM9601332.1 Bro-N domain-containing protein [Pseudomonas shirazica]MDO2414718.1 Bro-N domain-containing protein [Pseudomonas shirazica]
MARNAEAAGHSLKTKKPQCGNTEASEINAVIDQENNVMGDNSTNVVPFNFGTQQIRTLLIEGEPWFVAGDISAALQYRDSFNMCRNLDDDEKGTQIVSTLGGAQEMLAINESGLYSAILRSRKSEAKRFKKWVTSEVLPAIRKTGRYDDQQGRLATLIGQTIGTDGFHMLGAIVKGKVASLPAPVQRRATAKIWSQVHAAFGVRSAADIPAEHLDGARNFIASYAVLEGEFLGKDKSNGLSMSLQDWVEACPVTRHAQAGQPVGRVILTGALCADMDTVKPLQRLINQLAKQGVDVSAYEVHYHFLLEYLRENRRFLRDAQRLMEKASENEFAFRTRVAA